MGETPWLDAWARVNITVNSYDKDAGRGTVEQIVNARVQEAFSHLCAAAVPVTPSKLDLATAMVALETCAVIQEDQQEGDGAASLRRVVAWLTDACRLVRDSDQTLPAGVTPPCESEKQMREYWRWMANQPFKLGRGQEIRDCGHEEPDDFPPWIEEIIARHCSFSDEADAVRRCTPEIIAGVRAGPTSDPQRGDLTDWCDRHMKSYPVNDCPDCVREASGVRASQSGSSEPRGYARVT